jgi:hypothetical protein
MHDNFNIILTEQHDSKKKNEKTQPEVDKYTNKSTWNQTWNHALLDKFLAHKVKQIKDIIKTRRTVKAITSFNIGIH